ncbi:group III truncated hemoglobin [Qipengyuania sp. YG27]|uniref:Group III truncated hemoglobin n=1 Tax=Qipengyuania mesophila TaxID=2867246 RepID=A0ABS7JQH5_9SPHN|nr:group III truncated hemoglobin [Qipengyuania mesophila]MBX7499887.1 group III truncated hemoglobin [Qipengyuania mesophila]
MQQVRERSREEVQAARAAKRAEAEALGVDEAFVARLVESFYAAVREDPLLGPIFSDRIADWPIHLERMKSFWRSILFNSGEFSGNPMRQHMAIPGLEERHFSRWLDLFYATLRDLEESPGGTLLVAARARSIADSLLTGIAVRRDGLVGSRAGKDLPHV